MKSVSVPLSSFGKEYLRRDFFKSIDESLENILSQYQRSFRGDAVDHNDNTSATDQFRLYPEFYDYMDHQSSGVNWEQVANVKKLLVALARFDDLPGNPKPKPRHRFQKQYHLLCVIALLPKLFGDSLHASLPELSKFLPIGQRIHQNVLAAWPRRWGKTTAQAMLCAAVAYSIPKSVGSVYSTGGRVAEALTKKAAGYISALDPDLKVMVGKERVKIFGEDNTERIIYSYPSNPEVRIRRKFYCFFLSLSLIIRWNLTLSHICSKCVCARVCLSLSLYDYL